MHNPVFRAVFARFLKFLSLSAKNRSFFVRRRSWRKRGGGRTRRREDVWVGRPVYVMTVRRGCKHPPLGCDLMTGQTEICITLGEVWVTSFPLHPKPPNFPSLGLHPGRGIPSCNWIVSEFRPGFHLLIGESSQSRLPNLTIQHSSLPLPPRHRHYYRPSVVRRRWLFIDVSKFVGSPVY